MKWCLSRNTTGVAIGSVYIVGIVIFLIFRSISYVQYDRITDPEYRAKYKNEALISMIIIAVQAIISALFIVAIVKRYKYLIIPWLLLGIYYLYCTGLYGFYWIIGSAMAGPSTWFLLLVFVIIVLLTVLQIAIFWFSCSLFKEIHVENKKSMIQVPTSDPQMVEEGSLI